VTDWQVDDLHQLLALMVRDGQGDDVHAALQADDPVAVWELAAGWAEEVSAFLLTQVGEERRRRLDEGHYGDNGDHLRSILTDEGFTGVLDRTALWPGDEASQVSLWLSEDGLLAELVEAQQRDATTSTATSVSSVSVYFNAYEPFPQDISGEFQGVAAAARRLCHVAGASGGAVRGPDGDFISVKGRIAGARLLLVRGALGGAGPIRVRLAALRAAADIVTPWRESPIGVLGGEAGHVRDRRRDPREEIDRALSWVGRRDSHANTERLLGLLSPEVHARLGQITPRRPQRDPVEPVGTAVRPADPPPVVLAVQLAEPEPRLACPICGSDTGLVLRLPADREIVEARCPLGHLYPTPVTITDFLNSGPTPEPPLT
jgi:hypothetical protein